MNSVLVGILAFLISYPIFSLLFKFIEYNFGTPIMIMFGLFLLIAIICIGVYIIRKQLEELGK